MLRCLLKAFKVNYSKNKQSNVIMNVSNLRVKRAKIDN